MAKYYRRAEAQGLLSEPLPDLAALDALRVQTLGRSDTLLH